MRTATTKTRTINSRLSIICGYNNVNKHKKHRQVLKEFRNWQQLPTPSYRNKLCDAMLRERTERTSAAFFARLQILSDAVEVLGQGLVELPPALGNGVCFEDGPVSQDTLVELKNTLNASSYCRTNCGNSINLFQTAHLVCECRQNIWSRFSKSRGASFFDACDKPHHARATRQD